MDSPCVGELANPESSACVPVIIMFIIYQVKLNMFKDFLDSNS